MSAMRGACIGKPWSGCDTLNWRCSVFDATGEWHEESVVTRHGFMVFAKRPLWRISRATRYTSPLTSVPKAPARCSDCLTNIAIGHTDGCKQRPIDDRSPVLSWRTRQAYYP